MVADKTDATIKVTLPTRTSKDGGGLTWKRETVAEDELSREVRRSANIETIEQAIEGARLTQHHDFWPSIERFADTCDKVLEENGFPGAIQEVRHDGQGKWWPHPPDAPMVPQPGETFKFTCGAKLAEARGDFSDAWYAGKIGLLCRAALNHKAKGDAGEPFLFAIIFEIAKLQTDWTWRRGNKPAILTGRKQRKALGVLRESRNMSAKAEVTRRRSLVATLMQETRLKGGALNAWLARELAERHGIAISTRTLRADRKAIRG